jgi:hypothetical protein
MGSKFDEWWLILECCPGLLQYYRHLIHQGTGIKLLKPSWGPHISVIRGEEIKEEFRHLWGKWNGRKVSFTYSPEDLFDEYRYWWINIQSPELAEIRQELGLPPKPKYSFHFTVGKEPMEGN